MDGGVDGPPLVIDAGPDAGPAPDAAAPVINGIVISEVVLFPQQDWGVSGGVGEAFSGIPGTGTVSSRDQYIEIHNTGTTAVNLSGWSISVIDSSSGEEDITPLANDMEEGIVLSLGGSSRNNTLNPGDYAILGNPVGTISTDAWIRLRDNRSVIVDDVEIGLDDFEDDGDDGAPAAEQNGFSHGLFDEAIARPDGRADTNDDRADFEKMFATPLGPNVRPTPLPDTEAPIARPAPDGADNWPVNQFARAVFSEQLDAASMSPASMELQVNGVVRPIRRLTFANNDSIAIAETVGVLPFGATVTLTARGTITDFAGNALGTDATFTYTTEAAPPDNASVLLNEICTDPQQDWNHSSDNGTPFSNTPGVNPSSRNASDEWIELLVSPTGSSISVEGYTIEVFNGPNLDSAAVQVTTLNSSKVGINEIQFSGGTLTSVPPGGRVVVGNPTGSMDNDVYVVLRDHTGLILDEVEIGGNSPNTDRGGDGTDLAGAGAPDEGLNGNATAPADETISRRRNGDGSAMDTGSDVNDWIQGAATILQPN